MKLLTLLKFGPHSQIRKPGGASSLVPQGDHDQSHGSWHGYRGFAHDHSFRRRDLSIKMIVIKIDPLFFSFIGHGAGKAIAKMSLKVTEKQELSPIVSA